MTLNQQVQSGRRNEYGRTGVIVPPRTTCFGMLNGPHACIIGGADDSRAAPDPIQEQIDELTERVAALEWLVQP